MTVTLARLIVCLLVTTALATGIGQAAETTLGDSTMKQTIPLPVPRKRSSCSVEEALAARRSTRDFTRGPLTLEQIGQLLWAAQGITHGDGLRTAPSAGALYPLELYMAVSRVEGLERGVYHYAPGSHSLRLHRSGNVLPRLAVAALGQDWLSESAAVLVVSAVESRTARKYGPDAKRYIAVEAGHAAENVALQAVALGLGTGFVGAFDAGEVADLLRLDSGEEALYLLPLGRPETPLGCGE